MDWLCERTCAALLVIVVNAALGGCTSPGGHRTTATIVADGVVYSGPIKSDATYFYGAVQLVTPGRAQPRMTWQQALSRCEPRDCNHGTNTKITLAIATTPQTGRVSANGTTKPATARVLSYVVISLHQQCRSSGGAAPAPGRPESTLVSANCDTILLINANTGRIEYDAYGKQ